MNKTPEKTPDNTPDEQFVTSSDSRAGWYLIAGFVAIIALLVAVEVIRKMG